MRGEDITFLVKLVASLEEAERQLEDAYAKNDVARFNQLKKFALDVQVKISEVLK
ncbi:hypothetical protein KAR91_32175 [Candidatus Pacearchaeota archaeon]|nr:hypothetical protein [Candidatus Pacearchaeota archaeon]